MAGALVVIPLAAMLIPIVAILVAVLVDVLFLGAILVKPTAAFFSDHLVRPIRHMLHPHHPAPR
jgi:hypothetical protein